jgi:hypothetical protein
MVLNFFFKKNKGFLRDKDGLRACFARAHASWIPDISNIEL